MLRRRVRRTSEQIIDSIYKVLPRNTYEPISHIAAKADVDWKTAKRYLALIWYIQKKQKGDWLQFMMVGEQPAYSCKGKQGRPSKREVERQENETS